MNCIITGASRGLGKAMAERFAAGGYDLLLSSLDEGRLSATVLEIKARYPAVSVRGKAADMASKQEVMELGRWILETGSSLDVLINNAGIFVSGGFREQDDGVLERLMAVNLYSAYHLTRHLLPTMKARRSGHIFNICSTASLQAYPNGAAYGISKYALAGLSANLREEGKEFGIKVTSVYPGAVFTDSWAGSGVDPHRIMRAEDVAEMVVTASRLSPQATVEEILLRPQMGDL